MARVAVRYSYDRRTSSEKMVLRTVEFPSSDGSKTYKLYPGTPLEQDGKSPDGVPFWTISGWHAPQPIDAALLDGKVLDLRKFFWDVARLGRGVFVPPRSFKEFILDFGDRMVIVEFDRKGPVAEVRGEDDYLVPLTVADFQSPERFLRAL